METRAGLSRRSKLRFIGIILNSNSNVKLNSMQNIKYFALRPDGGNMMMLQGFSNENTDSDV